MLFTTEAYKSVVVQPDRTWRVNLTATLDSGDVLDITEKQLALGTFTFKEGATCTDTIQVGSTFANSLEFSLTNEDGWLNKYNFSYARIKATVGLLVCETYEDIPLGVFNVIQCGKKLATMSLSCMDDMYKANTYMPEGYISYPVSILEFVQRLCQYCNIPLSEIFTTELRESSIIIDEFDHTQYTCRDILSYIGVLLGKNLRVNRRDGFLESFWYASHDQKTTVDTRVNVSEYEEYDMNITGVEFHDADDNAYTVGTEEHMLIFEANPLVHTEEMSTTVANKLYDRLNALTYRPCKVYFMGDPSWQAGDIITHVRADESEVVAPLMLHTFSFRQTTTLETKGELVEQDRQLTSQAQKLVAAQLQAAKDLNKGLSSTQQTILQQTELLTNALGFYPKVEYNDGGSIQAVYLMSTPENTDTTTVWVVTSNGIGVSHSGLDGPYTSTWTADDSIVASIITADMIKTGTLDAKVLNVQATRDHIGLTEDLENAYNYLEEMSSSFEVGLSGIEGRVETAEGNISELQQTGGQVSVTVAKEDATLKTVINNEGTWESTYTDAQGQEISGIHFDFSIGKFVFDGEIDADSGTIAGWEVKDNALTKTYKVTYPTFTQTDLDKISDYILGKDTLTDDELEKYDVNDDGKVSNGDAVLIKQLIRDGYDYSTVQMTFDPSNPRKCIVVEIIDGFKKGSKSIVGCFGITGNTVSNNEGTVIESDGTSNIIARFG